MRNSRLERKYREYQENSNRRAIAFLLLLVMLFAVPLGAFAAEMAASGKAGGGNTVSLLGQTMTAPSDEAFESLTVTAGEVNERNEITFTFAAKLADFWLADKLVDFLDNLGGREQLTASFDEYCAYLQTAPETSLAAISFDGIIADIALPQATSDSIDTRNTIAHGSSITSIGAYTFTPQSSNQLSFSFSLEKYLYNCANIGMLKTFTFTLEGENRQGQTPDLTCVKGSGTISLDWKGLSSSSPPANISTSH